MRSELGQPVAADAGPVGGGLSVVPGVLLVLVSLVMPDTPRWYMRVGRSADAKACLAKTLGGDVDGRLGAIQRELSDSKTVG